MSAATIPPNAARKPVTRERIRSLSRGTEVELIVIRPEDAGPDLPVCLALHGRSEGAGMFVDLDVPKTLSSVVNYQGTPPFAIVAVDGGDSYWVGGDEDDDPQAMLAEELPTWLEERGLATNPFAVLGISMGGYGAFNYAANLNDPAIAAVSPAIFLSWPEARNREVFTDEAQWNDTDPLQHLDAIATLPLGVWCGESDPFIDAARQLVEEAEPAVSHIEPGDHDEEYWRKVMPDVLKFIGNRIG
ncbi:MAG: alpha/beta hydrolase [Actinophytocola sp.]|uniref:alpha/beta hydrolase n=1 Tax=Actinophytocola sp. TaxID=1872138 RepID=UPI003D6A613D